MGCTTSAVKPVSTIISEIGDERKHGLPDPPEPPTALRLAWFDSSIQDFEIQDLGKFLNNKTEIVMGRSNDSDLQVKHRTVSGKHCLLKISESGTELTISDLSGRATAVLTAGGQFQRLRNASVGAQKEISSLEETPQTSALPYAGALRLGHIFVSILPSALQTLKLGFMIKCVKGASLLGKSWFLPHVFHGEITIGRSSRNLIRVEGASVSGYHCSISQIPDDQDWSGVYILEDQNSTHSTFINGQDCRGDGVRKLVLFPGVQFSVGLHEDQHTFEIQYQRTD